MSSASWFLNISFTRFSCSPSCTAITGSQLYLECDAMEYATRYRFRGKIVGLDDKYKLLASSVTPMVKLEGVAAGLTLEIIAQAVDGNSQGVACAPILVTMPLTESKSEASASSAPELAPLSAITPNGNGSRRSQKVS